MSANNRFLWSLIAACGMAAVFALALATNGYAAGPRLVADTVTATTAISSADLMKFIRATGHEPAVLNLTGRSPHAAAIAT